ncbi:MAG: DUF1828 domain-containing protein [Candidatus Cloacimonetes bacterium]|jgi:hypothetical protein|nr:DUF1828 domain-containing protein [Candidatus Cloacimonadota bacterium]MCB5288011.1 DUF1828 domain-containing protein [Candidatus Cloacimonadota bacterium]MCK9185400.1 DUF1828 domain-containing protein [Candidatus Cloacimonadota bacterium]MCK9584410.1 DUF1828 domain-containing protein [Candidatus Cloacimonadota bacterium]MDY0230333.1 DUF1828 domain-containing protein [Candidatus Cloacimonadaceae bacterium]
MKKIIEQLHNQVRHNINTRPITESKFQVWLPVYYEDGDMVDIFVESMQDKSYKITDSGMTVMKLSYNYDINTDNKKKILNQIIESNGLSIENGTLIKVVHIDALYKELVRFSNTIMRISTMSYFKREMIKNMFYELFDEYVTEQISPLFAVEKQFMPIPGKEEYAVDYRILGNRDIYLYAVKDSSKARLVTICEQTFKLNKIDSDSIIVYEDFSSIQTKDQKRILNATGKQFTSMDEFQINGIDYLRKRIA